MVPNMNHNNMEHNDAITIVAASPRRDPIMMDRKVLRGRSCERKIEEPGNASALPSSHRRVNHPRPNKRSKRKGKFVAKLTDEIVDLQDQLNQAKTDQQPSTEEKYQKMYDNAVAKSDLELNLAHDLTNNELSKHAALKNVELGKEAQAISQSNLFSEDVLDSRVRSHQLEEKLNTKKEVISKKHSLKLKKKCARISSENRFNDRKEATSARIVSAYYHEGASWRLFGAAGVFMSLLSALGHDALPLLIIPLVFLFVLYRRSRFGRPIKSGMKVGTDIEDLTFPEIIRRYNENQFVKLPFTPFTGKTLKIEIVGEHRYVEENDQRPAEKRGAILFDAVNCLQLVQVLDGLNSYKLLIHEDMAMHMVNTNLMKHIGDAKASIDNLQRNLPHYNIDCSTRSIVCPDSAKYALILLEIKRHIREERESENISFL